MLIQKVCRFNRTIDFEMNKFGQGEEYRSMRYKAERLWCTINFSNKKLNIKIISVKLISVTENKGTFCDEVAHNIPPEFGHFPSDKNY